MISSSENRVSYNGNGTATEFAYQFKILEKSDIKVMRVDADGNTEILTKDYYVDAEKNVVIYPGYAPGAEIPESERPPVLPSGWRLVLYREVPITQLSRLPEIWPFNVIEAMADKLTIICQQLKDAISRCLKINESSDKNIDTTIPWEAGKTFRVSDDGTHLESTEDPGKVYEASKGFAEAAATSATNAIAANKEAQQANEEVKQIYNNGMLTPISDLAGSIGTELKRWGTIFANKVFASNLPLMYNSVADMKSDKKLKAGMTACTLGYYSPNDGGAGTYIIRAKQDGDVDDGGSLHELANGNVAELVVENGIIIVEQFGAVGEKTNVGLERVTLYINHNAGSAYNFKRFFIKGSNLILTSKWNVSIPNQFTTFEMNILSITGNFSDYLIAFTGIIQCSEINIGMLENDGGGCISIIPQTSSEWMQYIKVRSNIVLAKNDSYGIYAHSNGSFINELDISVNRFMQGLNGLRLHSCHSAILNHCGFEYGSLYLENCAFTTLIGCRIIEDTTAQYRFETVGDCDQLMIFGGDMLELGVETKYKFSDSTTGKCILMANDSYYFGKWRNSIEFNIWNGRVYNSDGGKYYNIKTNSIDTTALNFVQPITNFNAYSCSEIILDGNIYGHPNGVNSITIQCRASVATVIKHKIGDVTYKICTLDSSLIPTSPEIAYVELKWINGTGNNFSTSNWLLNITNVYITSSTTRGVK